MQPFYDKTAQSCDSLLGSVTSQSTRAAVYA